VSQGISLLRAVETQHDQSTDVRANVPPPYSINAIWEWVAYVTENENLLMLRRARSLRHEDGVSYRSATIELFARVLGVQFQSGKMASPLVGEVHEIGDGWNVIADVRSREGQAKFVVQTILPPQKTEGFR
jgi:hypothetical protein